MIRTPQSYQASKASETLSSDDGSTLSELVKHAEALLRLESILKASVDSRPEIPFQVAAVRKNRLILISPSATLATRLKLQVPSLLESLRANGITSIEYIDLRVAPVSRAAVTEKRKKALSPAASKALESLSAVIKKPTADTDGG